MSPNKEAAMAPPVRKWGEYYRWTAGRPPRDLLLRTFDHLGWETRLRRVPRAIEIGCGSGNDALELLRRGWEVLAIDRELAALRMLDRRAPTRTRGRLTLLQGDIVGLQPPHADLIYASFSLPFVPPEHFQTVWTAIRRALPQGGHFAGQLFGNRDEWAGDPTMSFHSRAAVGRLARGYQVELLREVDELGMSFEGRKRWHYFDVILEKR